MRGVLFAVLLGGLLLNNPLYAESLLVTDAPGQSAGVSFKKPPKIEFDNADLEGQTRSAALKVFIDEQGKVSKIVVVKSTGLPKMDAKLIAAFKRVEFTPYMENGKAIAVYTVLDFNLVLSN